MKKRICALLLMAAMLTALVPFASIGTTAYAARIVIDTLDGAHGLDYTSSAKLAAALDDVFSGKVGLYTDSTFTTEKSAPVGSSVVNSSSTYYLKSKNNGNVMFGSTCYIYANAVYNTLCGEWVRHAEALSLSDIVLSGGTQQLSYQMLAQAGVKCGAYMRTCNNAQGNYSGSGAHSMIILSYNQERITVLEGNADSKGMIRITSREWDDFNSNQFTSKNRYLSHIVQLPAAQYDKLYGTPSLTGISVASKPSKLTYRVGDTLSTAGLKLTASYSDGSTKNVTDGFTCTPTALNTAGTQTVTVTYQGKKATFDVTVQPVHPISITQQPVNASGKIGSNVTFTVKAAGENVSYQWYYKKADATSWTKWNGRTSASATATVYASWNGTKYYCKLTDANGNTLNSGSAKMLVATDITEQPKNASGKINDKVTFTVKATGSGLTYQWYYKKADAASWTKWEGRTTDSATATVYASWNNAKYYCKITDANGKTVNSGSAKMLVATDITQQPVNATGKVGDKVTFSVKATGAGISYKWYYKKADASAWTEWKNGTSSTLTATVYNSWNNAKFYCKITDANGKTVNSGSAKMFVG